MKILTIYEILGNTNMAAKHVLNYSNSWIPPFNNHVYCWDNNYNEIDMWCWCNSQSTIVLDATHIKANRWKHGKEARKAVYNYM